MAGLVSYGSSDDEDYVQEKVAQSSLKAKSSTVSVNAPTNGLKFEEQSNGQDPTAQTQPKSIEPDTPLEGPVIGPTIPADAPGPEMLEEDAEVIPQSPYSANHALLRDLTLPTLPNYVIPPSPPGSPAESTNAKFKHFLQLKKQGIHFNEKLAKSSALKNPSLMQKLMEFSDINDAEQYCTILPKDSWNPEGFPERAYKEELAKGQQQILRKKEEEKSRGQRESVNFNPATATGDSLSRNGTPGAKFGQKSAAERVMAGLERGRSNSPQVPGLKRKSRFDS